MDDPTNTPAHWSIETERLQGVHLSTVEPETMRQFYLRNLQHLASTSPSRPGGFYTREFWAERLVLARSELEEGVAVRLSDGYAAQSP